ncbi:MAG TPA: FRG domain-containing protein [Rhizomicrobium sp.]|jgi:hypothetical protein|nr:FRG domain-containing protein [Rhizomicrobium sp.]
MGSAEIIPVKTWEDCEKRLRKLEAKHSTPSTRCWFRGHSRRDWRLKTTLERRYAAQFSVGQYFDLMTQTLPLVENFTGGTWPEPKWEKFEGRFNRYFLANGALSYMAYLRHHGFPSPFLDWTSSPYIAAYFAFAEARRVDTETQPDPMVAIFAYSETPNHVKTSKSDGPFIVTHGGFGLRTHTRHFQQKSCYTVCVEKRDDIWWFVPHQQVFDYGDGIQDKLYKIEIPYSERVKALTFFDKFNLNHVSLFGSAESLMETLAFRFIDK